MTLRSILLLLAAIGVAGLTAVFANNWISAERAALLASNKPAEKVRGDFVMVAAKPLSAGTFVKPGDLKWQPWPSDGVTAGYAVKGKKKIKEFEGAVVRTEMAAGEPLTEARVVHPGERGFLAAVVTPGARAVSVPVNATTGIAGFVFPGDRVDVILTLRFKSEVEKSQTRYFSETLLTGVRVLAIDQKVQNADGKAAVAKTATIEVTPKQAEKVALGLNMGDLSLSLHSIARTEDRFAELAREMGMLDAMGNAKGEDGAGKDRGLSGDGAGAGTKGSYTMDTEIYFMGQGGGAGVNVLRGTKAELAKF